MAKEEINFIRPQEVYTPATNKAKVRYRGYNGKDHEVQLAENLDGDVEEIVNDTFVPNEGGNVVFTDGNNVAHELLTTEGGGGGGGTLVINATIESDDTPVTVDVSSAEVIEALNNGIMVMYILAEGVRTTYYASGLIERQNTIRFATKYVHDGTSLVREGDGG